jgi:type I restriction enzyme S subunit
MRNGSDWETAKLGSLCTKIRSGITPKGGSSVYEDEGVPIIRSQNVYNFQFSKDGLAFLGPKWAREMKRMEVQNDDVLLNITGDSVARCCIPPDEVLPARVNQHVEIIRTDKEKLLPRFLMYFLTSPFMQSKMLSLAGSGGTRKALTKGMIIDFDVPVPSTAEQQKVVDILAAYDDLIEVNRQRIERLERAARLLYREWFVHHRFPGHEHTEIVDGVPEGWEKRLLSDLFRFRNGKAPSTSEEGQYPVFGSNGKIGFSKDYRHENAIIIGRVGAYCGAIEICKGKFWPSDNTIVAMPKKNNIHFFYHLLSDFPLRRLAGGAAQPLLTQKLLKTVELPVPPESLMEEFEKPVSRMMQMVTNLEKQNSKLRQARDILLPRLMSGEITV